MKERDKTRAKIAQIIRQARPRKHKQRLDSENLKGLGTASGVVLSVLAAAGVISLSAVAPNMFLALGAFGRLVKASRRNGHSGREKLAEIVYYLKKSSQIHIRPTQNDVIVTLTKKGKSRIAKANLGAIRIAKPEKWPGTWWQVAADIPTKKYRLAADAFRRRLISMGFYPLQRTLWFYPYNPKCEVQTLLTHYNLGRFVTVMEIARMDLDDEAKMLKFFRKIKVL